MYRDLVTLERGEHTKEKKDHIEFVERFCEMELREPHSKPTHNLFGRTDSNRKKRTNEKGKEKQNKGHCFQENSRIKAISLKLT